MASTRLESSREMGLLLLGFILHTADAAGADTIERIALITAAVEICFIGLFASRA